MYMIEKMSNADKNLLKAILITLCLYSGIQSQIIQAENNKKYANREHAKHVLLSKRLTNLLRKSLFWSCGSCTDFNLNYRLRV